MADFEPYEGRHSMEDIDAAIERSAANATKISAIETSITQLDSEVQNKQDQLTESQIAAVNSGVTSTVIDTVNQLATNVSDLNNNVDDLANDVSGIGESIEKLDNAVSNKNLLSTPSGTNTLPTRWVDVPISVEPGEYVIHFESLTSTDTDSDKCQVYAFTSNNEAASTSILMGRGTKVHSNITIVKTTGYIRIYASDVYDHSAGDEVSFSGAMVCTKADYDKSPDYVPCKASGDSTSLLPSGDTTDRGPDILRMLVSYGQCNLSKGVYYVHGFEMPEGSSLTGCGKQTIVRLIESEDADYCVRIHRNNTVKNICFSGGLTAPSDLTTPDTDLGNRHGVYLAANADGQSATHTGSLTNIVTACFFENFNGSGFYAENTGGSMDNAVIMSDCRFYNCKVGINLNYYTEYSKFANCIVYSSNVACINNGGNNVFTACTFHGVKGFVIDNSDNDKRNCAHGSVIGCTFNHIDNANRASTLGGGNAIEIKGITNAFVFSGCQLWYGAIDISNSRGVSFSNCLLGGNAPAITVSGDYGVTFCGCTFHQMPELNVNAGTKFDSCYVDYTGEAVYPNSAITSLINDGAKNLIEFKSGSNTLPTRWIDIPCTVSEGEYVISFESLTSTDTDATVCQMALFDGTTARSKWQNLNRGTNISANVSVLGDTTHIRIYASDSYAHSENDTVTITNAMLCTKDNWDMSHDYVDYCPTVKELYQMVKDLQSQS